MKYLSRLLLLLPFVIYSVTSFAQGIIKGKLSDEKKSPLPSVVIRLKKAPDTIVYKAVSTDASGNFSFADVPHGNYSLQAVLIGYQPFAKPDLTIGPGDTLLDIGVIILEPSATMLSEVSVKARVPVIEKQIDKTVVNVDQTITATGTNALELLKKLPGVQVAPDGSISLNGHAGVNVIIDGKATHLSTADLVSMLGNTPSSDIQKVELMTNPSAKYDAEGTGGIINLVRKKNTQNGLNGSINGSLGQGVYGRYNSSLALSYKNDHYNLYVNNSYSFNQTLLSGSAIADIFNGSTLLTEDISANDRKATSRAYNSQAGIDLYLSKKTTLTVSGKISDQTSEEKVHSLLDIFDGDHSKTGHQDFLGIYKDKPFNYTAGMQVLHQIDTSGRQWSADADYSVYRYRPGQFNTTINDDASGNFLNMQNVFIDEARTLHIFGARADYVQPVHGGKIEAGLKSSYVKTNNNSTYYNQSGGENVADPALSDYNINTENINAAYLNFNRQFGRLAVQAGLRAEQTIMKGVQLAGNAVVDQRYFKLFPTLFLNEKLNDDHSFNFQFGRRVDRADYHELVPFRRPLSTTLYFEGNPNLKPDLNWHTELSWTWKNTLFITAAYDIDRDYLRTLPYLDSNKITVTRFPTNMQGARSWNFNISYNKDITKWFTTNTTVSIYRNLFTGNANGFSLNDPGFVSCDLVSSNTFRLNDGLSLEADMEHETRRQFVGSVYPAYTTLDLAIKEKILHNKGTITLNGKNVLNIIKDSGGDHYLNLYQTGHTNTYATRVVIATFTYRFGSSKLSKTQSRSGSQEEQQRAGN